VQNYIRAEELKNEQKVIEQAIADLQQQERLTVHVAPFSIGENTAVIEKNPSNGLDDYGVASTIPGFDQRVRDFEQRMTSVYGDNTMVRGHTTKLTCSTVQPSPIPQS